MSRNKKKRKKSKNSNSTKISSFFSKEETKRYIFGITSFLLAIIFALSFFEKAGVAGNALFKAFSFLAGKAIFLLPLILTISGLAFFRANYKKLFQPLLLAIIISVFGICGILESLEPGLRQGGLLGYILTLVLSRLFGFWVTQIIASLVIVIGGLIFWRLLKQPVSEESEIKEEKKPSLIKRIFTPSFKVKNVEPASAFKKEERVIKEPFLKLKTKAIEYPEREKEYKTPPIELLDSTKGQPSAGDIKTNSIIIKKALESFEIPVEMSEVNVGPTVTQYSLKPANGIKLSRITSLSNDLALALATHPIRIEAPIPGKSLVGIEVPNKVRAFVRLKGLIQNSKFQEYSSQLTFCLGKDVSGNPVYADLGKMPHLLVAGSTGTGKTIFLNTLILSLIYKNSSDNLKFILIDPKRVEFTVYGGLPHLLCPAIVDASRAVNALKWLIEEMERRFKLLAKLKARNIFSYNEKAFNTGDEHLSYIVLVIDELADLMVAKGRDVEASIVRLAQMARAVGVHIVVATQRPSVEIITGLIKANISSRITFQVASQVDSRTVLDMAGAEKLLGAGDMLFISSEIVKPKRIQAAYVSEKEVKRVVNWIKSKTQPKFERENLKEKLFEALERNLGASGGDLGSFFSQEDSLYEEAKRVIIQNRRASASFLQRKLRIGYARAARLIDMLEERRVVGPGRGAKPREVYLSDADESHIEGVSQNEKYDDDGWQSV
ncbi:MAG: DUF87 domain-containing protein [Candidatus Nealsonbacteria bacterium]|nr:MAG: DUF87 domain-containing protein [Candidatus Nealsonbacteria bacterium]